MSLLLNTLHSKTSLFRVGDSMMRILALNVKKGEIKGSGEFKGYLT